MTILRILQYPDARLRLKGATVLDFGAEFQCLINDLFETHYAQKQCAALAATQLDVRDPPHVTVIDFSEHKNQPLCLVNARIVSHSGHMNQPEGCMSVTDLHGVHLSASVKRSERIHVRAQDRHGSDLEFSAEGFMAQCIQHELDHLEGILFIDRLSGLKRGRLLKKLKQ